MADQAEDANPSHLDDLFTDDRSDENIESTEGNQDEQIQKQEGEEQQTLVKADEEAAAKDKIEKVVPYGAMHEERMRRKEFQQEVRELKEQNQKMEGRFQQVMEKISQPTESFEEDPLEEIKVKQDQIIGRMDQQDQRSVLQNEANQQQQATNNLLNRYQSSAAAYARENPNFAEAYQGYLNTRTNDLIAAGYSHDEAADQVSNEEIDIVRRSYDNGDNPAERIFNLAKARGYQPKSLSQKTENEQKLDSIQQGQGKTLSGTGGEAGVSLEALANMEDAEFDINWDKLIK